MAHAFVMAALRMANIAVSALRAEELSEAGFRGQVIWATNWLDHGPNSGPVCDWHALVKSKLVDAVLDVSPIQQGMPRSRSGAWTTSHQCTPRASSDAARFLLHMIAEYH